MRKYQIAELKRKVIKRFRAENKDPNSILEEEIEKYTINDIDKAWQYLRKNDPDLQKSAIAAYELGYKLTKDIDIRILATMLLRYQLKRAIFEDNLEE